MGGTGNISESIENYNKKLYDFVTALILTYQLNCVPVSPPSRWQHEWPKHVSGYHVTKLNLYIQMHLLFFFNV
jgi:hypothetical protein